MFKIKIGVVLAAVVAVFAISAAPSMAFTEFIQKQAKAGNQSKGGKQAFTITHGTVECEREESNGGSVEEKSSQAFEQVKYLKCKAFGFPTVVKAALYNFHANGTVSVENQIYVNVEKGLCELVVSPQENQNLTGVTYSNIGSGEGIEIKVKQKGIITYNLTASKGNTCGTTGVAHDGSYEGEAKTQKYTGSSCVFVEKGPYQDPNCQIQSATGRWAKLESYKTLEVM